MKKTTIGIILLIIAIALFMSLSQKDASEQVVIAPKNQATTLDQENIETIDTALIGGEFEVASQSTVNWTGKAVGKSHTGTLGIQKGTFIVNEGQLTGALVFDMNTLDSPDGEGLVNHLKNEDFFETTTYPTSELIITNYAEGVLEGELTIKGIVNTVYLPVSISSLGEVLLVVGDITFDRTDWNIQYGSGSFYDDLGDKAIADDINLEFALTARKKDVAGE